MNLINNYGEFALTNYGEFFNRISLDYEYALSTVKDLDTSAQEGRTKIKNKSAINILVEYGIATHLCSSPPEGSKLAIVISPPVVRFCPSKDKLDGVFFEQYSPEKHGKVFLELTKSDIFDFSNIQSRLDGWEFFAEMVMLGRVGEVK